MYGLKLLFRDCQITGQNNVCPRLDFTADWYLADELPPWNVSSSSKVSLKAVDHSLRLVLLIQLSRCSTWKTEKNALQNISKKCFQLVWVFETILQTRTTCHFFLSFCLPLIQTGERYSCMVVTVLLLTGVKPLLFVCTVCIQHSSTSAPGTGTVSSPTRLWVLWPRPQQMASQFYPCSICGPWCPAEYLLGLQKLGESSMWRRSEVRGMTSVRGPGEGCCPWGLVWEISPSPVASFEGWPVWLKSRNAAWAACRFRGRVPAASSMFARYTIPKLRDTYRWSPPPPWSPVRDKC